MRYTAYVVMAAAVMMLGVPLTHAQVATESAAAITINTDAATYNHDSIIQVTGSVKVTKGIPITLQVISPQGNIVAIKQLEVDSSNSFSTSLNTAGSLWNYDGRYTIKVQYGESVTNKAHVDLEGGTTSLPRGDTTPAVPDIECGAGMLSVAGSCVEYSITGGSVTGASASYAGAGGNSLRIDIDATDDGTIRVSPNTSGCGDTDYIVLVDGAHWDDVSMTGAMLTVDFFAGASSVEIVGACVVPEFGSIAVIVLVVALVAIVAASTRTRVGIMPKY